MLSQIYTHGRDNQLTPMVPVYDAIVYLFNLYMDAFNRATWTWSDRVWDGPDGSSRAPFSTPLRRQHPLTLPLSKSTELHVRVRPTPWMCVGCIGLCEAAGLTFFYPDRGHIELRALARGEGDESKDMSRIP